MLILKDLMSNTKFPKFCLLLFSILVLGVINSIAAQTPPKKTPVKKRHVKKRAHTTIEDGKILIANANCLSCHKPDIKLIGPAFKDIAAKYPASEENYQQLSKKIINGGSGNWGSLNMSPHPDLPLADAKKMAQYILSLK